MDVFDQLDEKADIFDEIDQGTPEIQSGLVEKRPSYLVRQPYGGGVFETPLPMRLVRNPQDVAEGLYNTLSKNLGAVISPGGVAASALAPIKAVQIPLTAYFGVKGAEGAGTGIGEMIAEPPRSPGEAVERTGDILTQLAMAAAPVAHVAIPGRVATPTEAVGRERVVEPMELPEQAKPAPEPAPPAPEPAPEPIAPTPPAEGAVPLSTAPSLTPEESAVEQARLASELGQEATSPAKVLKALREEGVTDENAKAILSGKKTPDQVVNEQLKVKTKYGSPDSPHLIIDENPDGSRTAIVTPDAGPARMTPKNIGQNPHDVALRMAIDQGVERINAVLEEHGLIPKRPSAEEEFARIQKAQDEIEAKRLKAPSPVIEGEAQPTVPEAGKAEGGVSAPPAPAIPEGGISPAKVQVGGGKPLGEMTPDEAIKSGADRGDYYREVESAFRKGKISDSEFLDRHQDFSDKWPRQKVGDIVWDDYNRQLATVKDISLGKVTLESEGSTYLMTPDYAKDPRAYAERRIKNNQPIPRELADKFPDLEVPKSAKRDLPESPRKAGGGSGDTPSQPPSALTPAESTRLQSLTEKLDSGKPLTSAEQKRYRALKDKVSPPEGEKPGVEAVPASTTPEVLPPLKMKPRTAIERRIQDAEAAVWSLQGLKPGLLDRLREEKERLGISDEEYVERLEHAAGKKTAVSVTTSEAATKELPPPKIDQPQSELKFRPRGPDEGLADYAKARREWLASKGIRPQKPTFPQSLEEAKRVTELSRIALEAALKTKNEAKISDARGRYLFNKTIVERMEDAESKASRGYYAPPTTPPSTGEGMAGPGARTIGEPPYRAIQQLTDQLEAAPPGPPKERIPMRERLADAWGQGKSAWEKALGKMTAAKQTLKDTARGVRTPKDMDRRVSELDWSLQQSAAQSLQAAKALEKQMPNKAMREAVAIWVDAGGDENLIRNVLANLPEGTPKNIRKALEVASRLPPESRQLAEQTRQFYGIRAQDGIQSDVLDHAIEDYYTHVWKDPENMPDDLRASFSNGRVSTFFKNALQRKIPTFLNGILQGKVPELDPVSVIPQYNYSLDRAIASRKFIKDISEMTEADGRPTVSPVGRQTKVGEPGAPPDEGALLIKPKARWEENGDYHYVDHPALRKWKWAGTDENGRTIMYQSDLVVHPAAYERLSRMMDRGRLTPSKLTAAALRLSTEVKGFKLGVLSAFHTMHVGSHALFHWTNPIKAGYTPIDWEAPETRFAVEKGHLKLAPNPSELEQFSEGLLGPGLVHKIPLIGAWSKQFSQWNFGTYIPRLKMATFENAFNRAKWFRDNPGEWARQNIVPNLSESVKTKLNPFERLSDEQIAARVGDSVNNAFGELNQLFLGKNGRAPGFQRLLRGIFLAPDFGEARLRFAEKAFTRFGHEERLALATMFGVFYTTARVANLVSTGDPQWDPKRAFSVKVGNHWWSMRSVIGDAWRAVNDFGKFLYPRLNPVYTRPIMDLIVGRDVMSGKKLTTFDKLVKRPFEQIVPIHLGGLTRDDQKVWESFAGSMGLAAIRDTPEMDMKRMAGQWLSDNGHPATAEYLPTDTPTYAKLRQALAIGNERNARKIVAALKQTHEDKKIMDAMERYVNHPFTGSNELEDTFVGGLSEANLKLYQRAKEQRQKTLEDFYKIWFSIPKPTE